MEAYCLRGKTVKIWVLSHGFGQGARLYLWGMGREGKVRREEKGGDSFFEVNMLGLTPCSPKSTCRLSNARFIEIDHSTDNPGCVHSRDFFRQHYVGVLKFVGRLLK